MDDQQPAAAPASAPPASASASASSVTGMTSSSADSASSSSAATTAAAATAGAGSAGSSSSSAAVPQKSLPRVSSFSKMLSALRAVTGSDSEADAEPEHPINIKPSSAASQASALPPPSVSVIQRTSSADERAGIADLTPLSALPP